MDQRAIQSQHHIMAPFKFSTLLCHVFTFLSFYYCLVFLTVQLASYFHTWQLLFSFFNLYPVYYFCRFACTLSKQHGAEVHDTCEVASDGLRNVLNTIHQQAGRFKFLEDF